MTMQNLVFDILDGRLYTQSKPLDKLIALRGRWEPFSNLSFF